MDPPTLTQCWDHWQHQFRKDWVGEGKGACILTTIISKKILSVPAFFARIVDSDWWRWNGVLAPVARILVVGQLIETSTLAATLPWLGSNPDQTKLLIPWFSWITPRCHNTFIESLCKQNRCCQIKGIIRAFWAKTWMKYKFETLTLWFDSEG